MINKEKDDFTSLLDSLRMSASEADFAQIVLEHLTQRLGAESGSVWLIQGDRLSLAASAPNAESVEISVMESAAIVLEFGLAFPSDDSFALLKNLDSASSLRCLQNESLTGFENSIFVDLRFYGVWLGVLSLKHQSLELSESDFIILKMHAVLISRTLHYNRFLTSIETQFKEPTCL